MKKFTLTILTSFMLLLFSSCEKEVNTTIETQEAITQEDITGIKRSEIPDDIKLDYHEKYGVIRADEYPMERRGTEITLETFLEKANLKKDDFADYRITERQFSGIGLAEHRINREVIQVHHEYKNEPVTVFEGVTHEGKRVTIIIIIICSNGLVIVIIL
ncbi:MULTISPECIES: hypothetical protein [Aquimarina]|uniref:hypothetical protein n=1 Tax=Aquimarina TaxID=290174 RepID=UPI000942110F|nr:MULTISPECIES: hypothetical protein [Aquimarina]